MRALLPCLFASIALACSCAAPESPAEDAGPGDEDGRVADSGGDGEVSPWGAIRPYFTAPPNDDSMADALIELVDATSESIDLATFVIDHDGFLDALGRAVDRGVTLRVVGDGEIAGDAASDAFTRLRALGAEVSLQRDDFYSSHNKFVVLDGSAVWTGSTNFTDNGLGRNNNASLHIDDLAVAEDYRREFEQMLDGDFGADKERTDEMVAFTVEGLRLETRFAPQEQPDSTLIALCDDAEQRLFFMIYVFTLDEMEEALLRAVRRGVEVSGIIDERFAAEDGAALVARLRAGGVDIGTDINSRGVWHHKVLIVDPQGDAPTLAMGSGNWTYSLGHGNDENYVIIRDRALVRAFLEEYQRWVP